MEEIFHSIFQKLLFQAGFAYHRDARTRRTADVNTEITENWFSPQSQTNHGEREREREREKRRVKVVLEEVDRRGFGQLPQPL